MSTEFPASVSVDPVVFDRRSVRLHRDRAADQFLQYRFLKEEAVEGLADRLLDIKRSFPMGLDLGCHDGTFAALVGTRGGIGSLVQMDMSRSMLGQTTGLRVVGDEEFLPFQANTFDLVVSALSLHWVNDLPGCLAQIRRILKPDGLFLGCLLGGQTLRELRQVLLKAELEVEGGVSPRVSPFIELRDAAALLQRARFDLPVADSDPRIVTYPDMLSLMRDLRGMAEVSALVTRRKSFTRAATLARAAALYAEEQSSTPSRITASFELMYLTGWRGTSPNG